MAIESCAVLGAGVMGSAIAAHLANAGFPVLLLDLPGKNGGDRNAIAKGAIERMQRADPQPFMTPDAARLITPGNFEDDMGRLAGCDWMIEAIVEDLRLKRALYDRIDAARKPGSIVSSNTSTIPLHALEAKQSRAFKQDFCITHFFNPPRYMRLLELVRGAETRPETITELAQVCDQRLGKGVVICHDTPGFIANRIGNYWITCAMSEAFQHGLTVEEADAAHRPMGIPKTGVFGLLDLVGIDLAPLVAKSMLATLPESDDFRRIFREHSLIARMIARGYTGRKGKGGFYRVVRDPGDRRREAIDLQTGEYRPVQKPKLEELEAGSRDLGALATHPGKVGRYVRAVLLQTLSYAASLVPEIADTVFDVDRAMRLGYAWKYGPFELIDRLGADNFAQALEAAGMAVPPLVRKGAGQRFYRVQEGRLQYLTVDGAYAPVVRPEGVLLLEDIKRASVPVMKNGSAALWDIRDGVVCFEFTTKMNALDPEVMALLGRAIAAIPGKYKGMVIYNEGENFSVGANLGVALFAANVAAWPVIEQSVESGQQTYKALKYAPFPVVGAPSGMALGGGCEILLHCSVI
ncbi:MAG: 3-hydroxyacyl-CoA dehydrogenase, partial [Acetobacteraceae bacterium]|nr:3-hydroxyacyl-CoA dehydrogenase [Acetobacteraceae bacterium]